MNDDLLATAISQTIPPEAGLAARVAQLERAVLGINSERVGEYQDHRDERHDVNEVLADLAHDIRNARRELAELRARTRDYIIATTIAGLLLGAAILTTWILR